MHKLYDLVNYFHTKGKSDTEIITALCELQRQQNTDSGSDDLSHLSDSVFRQEEAKRQTPQYKNKFYSEFGTPQYEKLSSYVKDFYCFKTTESQMFRYDEGYYINVGSIKLDSIILNLTKGKFKPTHLVGFNKTIRAVCLVEDLTELRQYCDSKINLFNGVLDVATKTLEPHSPSYFFNYKLDHAYQPNADSPTKWLNFLDDIFSGNSELVDVSAEIFGYCLAGGDPWLHKAFVLYGEGRNGKSIWLKMLMELLGSKNYSSVKMGNLEKPFSVVNLDSKLANIVEESPTKMIDSESFKTAVGGGILTASQKGKPEYDLKINARLLFACNKLPQFGDATIGTWQKLYLLPFKKYIEPSKRNPHIFKDFEGEMSGVLNWALDGLTRLVARGHMAETAATKELITEYRQDSDTVFNWVCNNIKYDSTSTDIYRIDKLYSKYKLYTDAGGSRFVKKTSFQKRFKTCLKEVLPPNVEVSSVAKRDKYGVVYIELRFV